MDDHTIRLLFVSMMHARCLQIFIPLHGSLYTFHAIFKPARVYSILAVQLIVTAISCFLFGLHPLLSSISQLSRHGQPSPLASIPLIGILASTVAWFRVCSSPEARRKSPNKWWWLGIFTLGEALSVGFLSSFYKFRSVVTAMGATAAASLAVSLYTIHQKNPNRDLSQIGASLSS